ncbi:MAG TPA: helix-turn-helix domain-containing protein [Chitinophagaceae bacterium]|nr:helix-turn-helix domain-containing protein [Chitinophagaceae bacterium]
MSSNIQIPKICQHCHKGFIAKTTVTKFCSLDCARKAYKADKRHKKIIKAQEVEYQKAAGIDLYIIQAKEYLSIKETCLLLGISRMSLHRYIKKKLIKPSNLGGRVIIQRKSIDNLLK